MDGASENLSKEKNQIGVIIQYLIIVQFYSTLSNIIRQKPFYMRIE